MSPPVANREGGGKPDILRLAQIAAAPAEVRLSPPAGRRRAENPRAAPDRSKARRPPGALPGSALGRRRRRERRFDR